jgi:hypothetical protein
MKPCAPSLLRLLGCVEVISLPLRGVIAQRLGFLKRYDGERVFGHSRRLGIASIGNEVCGPDSSGQRTGDLSVTRSVIIRQTHAHLIDKFVARSARGSDCLGRGQRPAGSQSGELRPGPNGVRLRGFGLLTRRDRVGARPVEYSSRLGSVGCGRHVERAKGLGCSLPRREVGEELCCARPLSSCLGGGFRPPILRIDRQQPESPGQRLDVCGLAEVGKRMPGNVARALSFGVLLSGCLLPEPSVPARLQMQARAPGR